MTRVSARLGKFGTILMLGNNFGVMANPRRARWMLRRFASMTSAAARIVAGCVDPYDTPDKVHRRYHPMNKGRDRAGGQIRVRVRYGSYCTPWFDWLLVSRREDGGHSGWNTLAHSTIRRLRKPRICRVHYQKGGSAIRG